MVPKQGVYMTTSVASACLDTTEIYGDYLFYDIDDATLKLGSGPPSQPRTGVQPPGCQARGPTGLRFARGYYFVLATRRTNPSGQLKPEQPVLARGPRAGRR